MATYPSISEPAATVESLQASVRQLKEAVELLTGQRGPVGEDPLSALEARLTKKIGELEASIEVQNETIVNETESLARRTTALSSQFYNAKESDFRFKARYGEVIVTQTNKTSALAQRTTTLEATVNNGTTGLLATRARLITEEQARATADTALAQRTNTLETTVNGQSATLETIQNSVNGISVKYGVTGYVNGQTGGFVFTGVALNGGGASFNMEFNSNVTINGNLLVNGSVDTGQIASSAVSNNAVAISYSATQGPGTIISVSLYAPEAGYLFCMSSWTQVFTGPSNTWNAALYVNGVGVASVGGASVDVAPCLTGGILVGAGYHTVYLSYSAAANVYAAQRSLSAWILKR